MLNNGLCKNPTIYYQVDFIFFKSPNEVETYGKRKHTKKNKY